MNEKLLSGVLCLSVVLIGCTPATDATSVPSTRRSSPTVAREMLANGLALALAEPHARAEVVAALRGSRHREHKVILQALLGSNTGSALRLALAQRLRARGEDLAGALASVSELELYAPVKAHRARVEKGDIAFVATQAREGAEIVAFRADGSQVRLGDKSPPSEPVLALVPRESTDAELAGAATRPAIGSLPPSISLDLDPIIPPCEHNPEDPNCPPGGGGPPASGTPFGVPSTTSARPAGLYVTDFNLWDDGEGWILGDPEIEVWMYGTLTGLYESANSSGVVNARFIPGATYSVPVGCAGNAHSVDGNWRNFNLDNTGFFTPTRPILFGKPSELYLEDVLGSRGSPNFLLMQRKVWLNAPYRIQVLERDDSRGGCPALPANRASAFAIGFASNGKPIINGLDYNDFVAILTTNNDVVLNQSYPSASALTQENGVWLTGGRGSVKVENFNFPASAIGTG